MIGLLDSGMGGVVTANEIRKLSPGVDLTLLLDRKNAPYGKKSEGELLEIVSYNIERLMSLGASRVLLACCTASTVWDMLPEKFQRASIPILTPTARRAVSVTKTGKIAVIATEATVRSGKWTKLLYPYRIFEVGAQELVALTESGACDGSVSEDARAIIRRVLSPLGKSGADTLILGCTHFPLLEEEIKNTVKEYGIKKVVSSAKEGALELLRRENPKEGSGRTVIIN